jgi:glycosyltransferase involved in cell wall biosynthesis
VSAIPERAVILNDYAATTGGSTAVAIASALGLAARGIAVTFLAGVGPVDPALAAAPGVRVVCLGQPELARDPRPLRAGLQGLRNGRALRALREILADLPRAGTVVHVHTWTKALSPAVPAAVARLGFPLVATLHDFFIACPNGGFFVHRTGELCGRRPLSAACLRCDCDRRRYAHKLWRSARTALQNRVLRLPERIAQYVAVSDFSLRMLRPHLPPGAPARVVRPPVDCPREGPAPVAENRDFLFIGRFEGEKGVALFAAAVRAAGARAVFVGSGALDPEVRRLCPEADFPGWLPASEVRRRLRRARALVFPPLWTETLGLVVVEAAAAGVPAIVSDRCAATDHIRDGVNGLTFAHGRADALAGRIAALRDDGALAARLGRAARDWYWGSPWTTRRHVDELLEVYAAAEGGAG